MLELMAYLSHILGGIKGGSINFNAHWKEGIEYFHCRSYNSIRRKVRLICCESWYSRSHSGLNTENGIGKLKLRKRS